MKRVGWLAIAGVCLVSPNAFGDPIFGARVATCGLRLPPLSTSVTSSVVTETTSCDAVASVAEATAGADVFGLHAGALVTRSAGAAGGPFYAVADTALYYEVTVSGPDPLAPFSLVLDLDSVAVDMLLDDSHVELGVWAEIDGHRFSGIVASDDDVDAEFAGLSPFLLSGHSTIETASVLVPVGVPIPMYLSLTALALADDPTTVSIDALHTLSFSKSGPVFVLPGGYTVADIPELGIYDNRFSPVPEPHVLGMLGLGVGWMVAFRRWRRA